MSSFKKATVGDRGKWTEKEVEKVLTSMSNSDIGFTYERLPDARAAGGRLKAQLCDFLCWHQTPMARWSIMLEAKETQHDYRLTNEKVKQLPRMKKVALAGGLGLILVFHSEIEKWRIAPLSFFADASAPSWDLRELPTYDNPAAALCSTGLFPMRG